MVLIAKNESAKGLHTSGRSAWALGRVPTGDSGDDEPLLAAGVQKAFLHAASLITAFRQSIASQDPSLTSTDHLGAYLGPLEHCAWTGGE